MRTLFSYRKLFEIYTNFSNYKVKSLVKSCKYVKSRSFSDTNHIEISRVLSGKTEMVTCNVSEGSNEFANSGHSMRHKFPV